VNSLGYTYQVRNAKVGDALGPTRSSRDICRFPESRNARNVNECLRTAMLKDHLHFLGPSRSTTFVYTWCLRTKVLGHKIAQGTTKGRQLIGLYRSTCWDAQLV
jgi:hypothetical protein